MKRSLYLDNAATSFPKASGVADAVAAYLTDVGASPARAGHARGLAASRLAFRAREGLAQVIGATDASRVAFMPSATEALNVAIAGTIRPGDHVLTTNMEHNAVWRPLVRARDAGVCVDVVRTVDRTDGEVIDAIAAALRPDTRAVAVQHASNVNGRVLPLHAIGALLASHPARLIVDAAQTAGLVPVDVEAMGVDLLAVPAHKGLLGPQGLGALYVAPGAEPEPLVVGGTGSHSELDAQPTAMPDRYESGTLNAPGIAGLVAALAHREKEGADTLRVREAARIAQLVRGLRELDGVRVLEVPPGARRTSAVSFEIPGADPALIADVLDRDFGIAARAGLHCAPAAHRALGTFPLGTVRLSPGPFTTEDEIDIALGAVREIATGRRDDVAL